MEAKKSISRKQSEDSQIATIDLTVRKKRFLTVYLTTPSGKTKRAYHQHGGIRWKQSCPCGIGQVERAVGVVCSYCSAVVTRVEERG